MKPRLLSAITLIAASLFALAVSAPSGLSQQQQRAKAAPRASAIPTKARSTSRRPAAAKKHVASPAQLLTVREVDAEGFSKLLVSASGAAAASDARRPLLINFWATWCVPCRDEFPDLVKIDNEFRARGLNFITVSLDDLSEIKTTVPQFLKEMNATRIPAYLLNTPEPETVITAVDPTWAGGLPATFLFDRHGKLIFKHMGRVRAAELRPAIESVVGDKSVISDK